MIFRDCYGNIIEINKSDYKNDYLYYTKIMNIKSNIIDQYQCEKIIKPLNKNNFFNSNSKQSIDKLLKEFN